MNKKINRTGFTFYKSYADIYYKLNDQQKILFIDAILTHQFTNAGTDSFTFDDALLDIAWLGITPNLHTNKVKFINGSKPKARASSKQDGSEQEAKHKRSANNENENENDNDNEAFDFFWKNYPRKEAKKQSRITFNRLTKVKQKLATEDCKLRYVDTELKFVPYAASYLNGERWDDELRNKPTRQGFVGGVRVIT